MKAWAIFYADSVVVEGDTMGEWLAAPLDGVIAVVQVDPYVSRSVWRGCDYYYAEPGAGDTCASDSILPYLVARGETVLGASDNEVGSHLRARHPAVKHGVMVSDLEWRETCAAIGIYERIPRVGGPRSERPDKDL